MMYGRIKIDTMAKNCIHGVSYGKRHEKRIAGGRHDYGTDENFSGR